MRDPVLIWGRTIMRVYYFELDLLDTFGGLKFIRIGLEYLAHIVCNQGFKR